MTREKEISVVKTTTTPTKTTTQQQQQQNGISSQQVIVQDDTVHFNRSSPSPSPSPSPSTAPPQAHNLPNTSSKTRFFHDNLFSSSSAAVHHHHHHQQGPQFYGSGGGAGDDSDSGEDDDDVEDDDDDEDGDNNEDNNDIANRNGKQTHNVPSFGSSEGVTVLKDTCSGQAGSNGVNVTNPDGGIYYSHFLQPAEGAGGGGGKDVTLAEHGCGFSGRKESSSLSSDSGESLRAILSDPVT